MAWKDDVQNGRIPTDLMRKATVIRGGNGLLRTDASVALDRLGLVALDQGYDVRVTDLYRTYTTQVRLKKQWCDRGRCHMAATPGTSNHGWGLACDNGYSYGSRSFGRFMHANASLCGRNGWVWPAWAQRARSYEIWHWEYVASLDRQRNQPVVNAAMPQEDDIVKFGDTSGSTNNQDFQRLLNGIMARTRALGWEHSIPLLVADGKLGPTTHTVYVHAMGRMRVWLGLDYTVVSNDGEVGPIQQAALTDFVVELGNKTGRNRIPNP